MQFWTCPYCGANLDYNEKCDCKKEKAVSAATKHGKRKTIYKNIVNQNKGDVKCQKMRAL
jgi:hypothetical protein